MQPNTPLTPFDKFRASQINTDALNKFLNSPTGKELEELLDIVRAQMTAPNESVSEKRCCGRHDAFQKIDEIFKFGTHHKPVKEPESKKGGRDKLKPHTT